MPTTGSVEGLLRLSRALWQSMKTMSAATALLSGVLRIEVPVGCSQFSEAGETIRWEPPANRFIENVSTPTLTLHLGANTRSPRPVIIVLPGGGYCGVSLDREGHQVAAWLTTLGFAGAVLKYRCPPEREGASGLPTPFVDVLAALDWVSVHAECLGLDTTQVGLMGFSAGGHLAGSIGLRFDQLRTKQSLPRPRFLSLVYPVVSSEIGLRHSGSFMNLAGADRGLITAEEFHLLNHVCSKSPPMFLAHAEDDPTVPIQGTKSLAEQAQRTGCAVALHVCKDGGHGFGLGIAGNDSTSWCEPFAKWLAARPWNTAKS